MEYLICLEKMYRLKMNKDKNIAIIDLEQMLDNMVDLARIYGIDDEEILDYILRDVDVINKGVVE